MSMKGCGITPYSSTFGSGANKGLGYNRRIGTSDSAPTMKVAFRTETVTARTFNVWVKLSAVKKFGADPNANSFVYIGSFGWDYYNRSTASAADTAVSNTRSRFSYTGNLGNYTWTIPFSSLPMNGDSSKTLASVMGTLTFAARSYDCFQLEITVRALWGDKLEGRSDQATSTCFVGFIPSYSPAVDTANASHNCGAWTTSGGDLVLCISEPNWMRTSDRWQVDQAIYMGGKKLVEAGYWDAGLTWQSSSTVLISIPKSKLLFTPGNGGYITAGRVRFAGAWQSSDGSAALGYCTWPSSTAAANLVKNTNQAKTADTSIGGSSSSAVYLWTPTITAVKSGRNVKVTVGQVQNGGNTKLGYIEVQMVGGTTAFDTAVLAPGESHVFYGVPWGVSTTWEATGYYESGDEVYQGKTVSATVGAISAKSDGGGTVLVNADGYEMKLVYNLAVRKVAKPEHEMLKFAGRERPSIAYGEGGTVEWSVDAAVFTETPPMGNVTVIPEQDILGMPMTGPWLIRGAEGERTMLAVTQATLSKAYKDRWWRSLSVTAEEVS